MTPNLSHIEVLIQKQEWRVIYVELLKLHAMPEEIAVLVLRSHQSPEWLKNFVRSYSTGTLRKWVG